VVPENKGGEVVLDDLVEFAEQQGLAKNKWPQILVLLDSLPMTSSGKLRRSVLQETVIKLLGLTEGNMS
jgi:acyl-CoA synthetase (AMP-forming)/AMP-acid ligase II